MEEILCLEEIFMEEACRPIHSDLKVVVRVGSFFSLPDGGPKTYLQGKTLPTQYVDMHNYSLLQLVNFIAEHYMWGSKQYMTLWRSLGNASIEIKSDEHLLEWFKLNLENGVVCIDAQVNDFDGPLQFSPIKHKFHPSVRNCAYTNEGATNERATSDAATNERATNKQGKKSKRKGSHDVEAVGVYDEDIYSDTDSLEALSDSNYDSNLATSSDSESVCSDPEFDPDDEIVDETDDDDVPIFSYDAHDPCIDVGVVFPDVDQCKSAVAHHAILNDHAFDTIKKDKDRFRAICKRAYSAGQTGGPAQHGTGPPPARPARARPVRHGSFSGPCRAGPRAVPPAQARPKGRSGRAVPARAHEWPMGRAWHATQEEASRPSRRGEEAAAPRPRAGPRATRALPRSCRRGDNLNSTSTAPRVGRGGGLWLHRELMQVVVVADATEGEELRLEVLEVDDGDRRRFLVLHTLVVVELQKPVVVLLLLLICLLLCPASSSSSSYPAAAAAAVGNPVVVVPRIQIPRRLLPRRYCCCSNARPSTSPDPITRSTRNTKTIKTIKMKKAAEEEEEEEEAA